MRALPVIAALAAGYLGCGGPRAPSKPRIGLSVLTLNNPFFVDVADAMRREAAARGYELVVTAGDYDIAKQKDQVNDFIVQRVAAIVLCPVDSKSIATSIAQANQAGIPVFTADIAVLIPGARIVSHVATDNAGGGRLAAQAMAEALGDGGKVALIDFPEVESAIMRMRGFQEEARRLAKERKVRLEIVTRLPGQGEKDKSFKAAEDILQAYPQVNGIFAVNDPSALGVVAALEKAGKAGRITVVGFDGLPEGRNAVRAGKLYATILQDPGQIGRRTAEAVARYMAGEQTEAEILIPARLYRKAEAEADPFFKKPPQP